MPYDRQTRSGLFPILIVVAFGLVAGDMFGALVIRAATWLGW